MLVANKSLDTKNVKYPGEENNFDALINTKDVYVFGSNNLGEHHSSGAQWVCENGLVNYGCDPKGISKTKRAYGIITKLKGDLMTKTEDEMLEYINEQTKEFINFAIQNKRLTFKVLPYGISRVHFDPKKIVAPFMEQEIPKNIILPKIFLDTIEEIKKNK